MAQLLEKVNILNNLNVLWLKEIVNLPNRCIIVRKIINVLNSLNVWIVRNSKYSKKFKCMMLRKNGSVYYKCMNCKCNIVRNIVKL